MPDENLFKVLWQLGVSAVGVVFGFLLHRSAKRNDELNDRLRDAESSLAAHKLHVSESYANKGEVQASLARIHDRLDDVGDDIKTLLGRVGK